jgi:hypothetical protein
MKVMNLPKLGCLPRKIDKRTIQLSDIMKAGLIPPTPDSFDVDASLGVKIPNPAFGNNQWGDCVMAARAHMTRRFGQFEEKIILPITDAEVLTEYWKEQGVVPQCWAKMFHSAPDGGLVMLTSLNFWRKGWIAAKRNYNIHAFAAINWLHHDEIYASHAYLRGDYIAIALPHSAIKQMQAVNSGGVWDAVDGPEGVPGSWNGVGTTGAGHCVYRKSYNKLTKMFTVSTWGFEMPMTEAFNDKYVTEDYAIVQNKEPFVANSPVDIPTLEAILQEITA